MYMPNRINSHIIIFKEIDTQNLKSIYHNYDFFFSSNSAFKNRNFASCAKGHGPGARVYKIFTYFISLQPAGKHCAAHSIEILPVLPHYWLPELNIPLINIVEGANTVLRKGYLCMEHYLMPNYIEVHILGFV